MTAGHLRLNLRLLLKMSGDKRNGEQDDSVDDEGREEAIELAKPKNNNCILFIHFNTCHDWQPPPTCKIIMYHI